MTEVFTSTETDKIYTSTGQLYVGLYFIERGVYYQGIPLNNSRIKLYLKKEADIRRVRNQISVKGSQFTPVPYKPNVENDSLGTNTIQRYFIQKRNAPYSTIVEINKEDYSIGSFAHGGNLTSKLYRGVSLTWQFAGEKEDVMSHNKKEIEKVSGDFAGLDLTLRNLLEFYKKL